MTDSGDEAPKGAEPKEAVPNGTDEVPGAAERKEPITSEVSSTTSGTVETEPGPEPVAEIPAAIVVSDSAAVAKAADSIDAKDNPDAPMLPDAYSETELRDAVGIAPRPRAGSHRRPEKLDVVAPKSRPAPKIADDRELRTRDDHDDGDDDDEKKPWSRRTIVVSGISIVAGLSIAALVFLGRANSAHYAIACTADRIVAEQGRAFPPWGSRERGGAEWKPIEIPPEAECAARSTDDDTELATWYLDALKDRATILLSAREVTKVDLAEQQLNQALLLARAPEKKDKRADIERLLGDVGYWRASAKLREAAVALTDAAKQFDTAAAQRPRIATDASAWANYIRKLVDQLHIGPAGSPTVFPPTPPPTVSERPVAPVGTALPVEPPTGSGSDTAPAAAPPPDAGVPSGGVLL